MPKTYQPGTEEWEAFEDWTNGRLGCRASWTLLAEQTEAEDLPGTTARESRAVVSFLTPQTEIGARPAMLGYTTWDVQAAPSWPEDGHDLREIMQGIASRDQATGQPDGYRFIGYRCALGGLPGEWHLTPALVEYFRLRQSSSGDWLDPYLGEIVVRMVSNDGGSRVEMRTDYLEDFLAAAGMVLVRQFDLARHWDPSTSAHDGGVHTGDLVTEWGCYWLDVVPAAGTIVGALSRLVAKDFVPPSSSPRTVGGVHEEAADPGHVPAFWLNGSGGAGPAQQVPSASEGRTAYFGRAVLQPYYDDPDRYTVKVHADEMGSVNFMGVWALRFSINREDLVVVWAGDLVKQGLPMREISHWHAHNVQPRGGLSAQFVRSQIMAEFPNTPSLEARLLESRSALTARLGELACPSYTPYSGPDVHSEKRIRRPTADTMAEFSDAILALSRVFIEYLDEAPIRQALPPDETADAGGQKLGGIVVFAKLLELKAGVGASAAEALKSALQRLQMARSKMAVSHRYSDNSRREALSKLGLSASATNIDVWDAVAGRLADALEGVCLDLGVGNKLWWRRRASTDGPGSTPAAGNGDGAPPG